MESMFWSKRNPLVFEVSLFQRSLATVVNHNLGEVLNKLSICKAVICRERKVVERVCYEGDFHSAAAALSCVGGISSHSALYKTGNLLVFNVHPEEAHIQTDAAITHSKVRAQFIVPGVFRAVTECRINCLIILQRSHIFCKVCLHII